MTIPSPPADAAQPRSSPGRPSRFGALQQRDFRLLWLGIVVNHVTSWMQQVTQSWLLWELTHSPFALGIYGLCRSVPFVLVSLYAGAISDRVDRRSLLVVTNAIGIIFPLTLGILVALGQIQPWHIYTIGLLNGIVDSFDGPAREALVPSLVPRSQLTSALGLMTGLRRATALIGPSLGGLAVFALGPAGAFYVNAVGSASVVVAALLMRARPPRTDHHSTSALAMVREGLTYVREHRLLGTLIAVEALITLCTTVYGIMPVFADVVLGVGPAGLGIMMSAPGVGAVLAAITTAAFADRITAKGWLMLASGALFGVCLFTFAVSRLFPLSLLALVGLGYWDTIYGAARNTIVQLAVSERFRGRVLSLQMVTQRGLGPSGQFVSGTLASLVGAPLAVASLAVIGTLLVVWRGLTLPALRDYRDAGPLG